MEHALAKALIYFSFLGSIAVAATFAAQLL